MVVFCKCVHLQSISFQKNQMHQMPSLHYDINVSTILLLLIINVSSVMGINMVLRVMKLIKQEKIIFFHRITRYILTS